MAQRLLSFAACCALFAAPLSSLRADDGEDFFENQIRPLLAERCVKCHGANRQSGGLRLDTREHLLKGGDSGEVVDLSDVPSSLLLTAVAGDGDLQMPPDDPISAAEVAALTQWLVAGAKWPTARPQIGTQGIDPAKSHWAFQPVRPVAVPTIADDGASRGLFLRTPIDAFVIRELDQQGLTASAEADRRTQVRRLYYSLTGLPPTYAQVQAAVMSSADHWYEDLVEELLGSVAYGEHWARHWLDVARYSDTKGYVYAREERFWTHAWPYRDWVISALNEDMPYDRFLSLQIAADQVSDRRETDLAAMGFLTLGRRFLGVQRDIIDDRIDVVTRGTMALTVGCARCHDHKYDPIPTADYYSLYGVFQSCREQTVPLIPPASVSEEFAKELAVRQGKLRETLQSRRESTMQRLRARVGDYLQAQFELDKYPEEGFDQVLSTNDLLPSFVRRWQEYLRQAQLNDDPIFTAWRATLDALDSQNVQEGEISENPLWNLPESTNPLVKEVFPDRPRSHADLVSRYADLFRKIDSEWQALVDATESKKSAAPDGFPDAAREQLRQVLYGQGSPCVVPDEPIVHTEYDFDSGACTELWKLQSAVDRWIIDSGQPFPVALILEDRAVPVTPRIFRRGDPGQKGDDVPRRFLQFLTGPDSGVFQHGSGRRELADAIVDEQNPLTARVIVNRVWAQHFGAGLVSSVGDFGTRATPPSHPELLDWLAQWFVSEGWSLKKLHRLIVTSGTFRQASTGPIDQSALQRCIQVDPGNRLLWRMAPHRLSFEEMRDSMLAAAGDLDEQPGGKPVNLFTKPFPTRRTIYGLIDRQFLPGTLRVFDFANPDLHIPQRSETTVPQQALFLMNHPLSLERVRRLAEAVTPGAAPNQQVDELFQQVLQRSPTAAERRDAEVFLESGAVDEEVVVRPTAADWSYGYGAFDKDAQRVTGFTRLPHFTGHEWQGGPAFPDKTLGWVQLHATGGHPGNDRAHACIRRWTAPRDMTVRIASTVVHDARPGDGIRVFVVSSETGLLDSGRLHMSKLKSAIPEHHVRAGETIDFVCDIGDVLNSDQHEWQISITSDSQPSVNWDSKEDFTRDVQQQLKALEQLAQILLCSNEFLFVD
ncbi:MAG: PSD1 domain-containing protein [Planctomycetaceae bacterium]|nr:PSD1 domain-containing protein [Planctomycetaceae bacterium]